MWPQCKTWRNPLDPQSPWNDRLPEIPVEDPTDEIYSGIPCTLSDNTNGTCLPISNCMKLGGISERDGCSGPDRIHVGNLCSKFHFKKVWSARELTVRY